jgi:nucleotide-binding universal stress UspA family protein
MFSCWKFGVFVFEIMVCTEMQSKTDPGKPFIDLSKSCDTMFKNILVAVDGYKYADAAFNAAVDVARRYDSRLIVLYVYQGSTGSGTLVSGDEEDANRSAGQEIIKSYERKLGKDFRKSRVFLKKGDAAQRIIETARSEGVDLVVIGSRGRGGFKGLLLGSVSHKVTNHVGCPVLIIR